MGEPSEAAALPAVQISAVLAGGKPVIGTEPGFALSPVAAALTPVVAAVKPRPPGRAVKEDDDDEPPERKRNRTAVRNYRARKKAYTARLEEEVERLRIQNFLLLKAMGQRTDMDKGMVAMMPPQQQLGLSEQLAAQILALQSQDVLQPHISAMPLQPQPGAQTAVLLGLQGIGALPGSMAAQPVDKKAELGQPSYPMTGLLGGGQSIPVGHMGGAGDGGRAASSNDNLTAVLKALLQQQQSGGASPAQPKGPGPAPTAPASPGPAADKSGAPDQSTMQSALLQLGYNVNNVMHMGGAGPGGHIPLGPGAL